MFPKIITGKKFYEKRKKLKLIKQINWENYYLDEINIEKWIEEFTNSEVQAGGSPQLRCLEKFPWE